MMQKYATKVEVYALRKHGGGIKQLPEKLKARRLQEGSLLKNDKTHYTRNYMIWN